MDSAIASARQDRAIEQADDDALDRGPFVDSLVKALVHSDRDMRGKVYARQATGFVVGLTGAWGLGKSSVLNLLKEQLDGMDHVAVAMLNPWLFKGRDELVTAYFAALRDALGRSLQERGRELQEQLHRYKDALSLGGTAAAALIDAHGGAGVATASWKMWGKPAVKTIPKPRELSADEERRSLEAKLAEAKVAVVVLIDELDRVEDDEVRAVAQLVKAVGDIKGISYLVAYDPDRVAQALGRGNDHETRKRSGEAYLEKIVQFPIPLRPLFEEDARALVESALRTNGVQLPEPEEKHEKAIVDELIRVARTPRDIKRTVGAFAVLEEIVRGEISPYDVLGYAWLATKAPGLRASIADHPERVVTDPGQHESSRRLLLRRGSSDQRKPETLEEALGPSVLGHEALLKLLFTRFGEEGREKIGNRISQRRNLIRLLYLGNPPGMVPRREIERIWSLSDDTVLAATLRQELDADRLPLILDRLDDLLPQLSADGDGSFWRSLARVLVRPHDWIASREPLRTLVDNAAENITKLGRSGEAGAARYRTVLQSLIDAKDLLIAPWLLRRQVYEHGLSQDSPSRRGDPLLSRAELDAYLASEIPRYRQAISEGYWLRRLPDTEALWAVWNLRRWDENLKSELTAQLASMPALTTFAALITPPGIITDQSSLEGLIDGPRVLATIVDKVKAEGEPDDPWLAASLVRLVATFRGHDTTFTDRLPDDYILNGLPVRQVDG